MANSSPSEVPYAIQGLEVGDSVENPILIDCDDINTVEQTPHGSQLYPFDDGAFQEALDRFGSEMGAIVESLYGTPLLNPIVIPESEVDHSKSQGNHSIVIESQSRSESTCRTGSPASPCPECLVHSLQELSPVDVGVQTAIPIRDERPTYLDASTQTTPHQALEENEVDIPEGLNSRKRKRERFAPSSIPLRRSSRLRTGQKT